ncbi:MAG: hypothetical protein WC277_09145 [Bacilli bacterium]
MSIVTLTIGGVDRTAYLTPGSVRPESALGNRGTCSFTVISPLAAGVPAFRPGDGEAVAVTNILSSAVVYAGTIDSVDEELLFDAEAARNEMRYRVSCVDYKQLADKRQVAESYSDTSAGDIFRDIVDKYLAVDGVTYTHVEDGPILELATFNYLPASQAFDEVCELIGYSWDIDTDRDLHLFERASNTAPFSLTVTSANWRRMRVQRPRDDYRNRQYIRAGTALSDSRSETFAGDGEIRSFLLSLPCGAVPTITLDSAAQTVGIGQVDTGKDWYWNKGSNVITQDASGTVLTSTTVLAVTYRGQYPLLVLAQDDAAIAARQTIEGGSGIYDAIEDASDIDDRALAEDKGRAYLRKYGVIPDIVTFETDADGLRAGQLISITVPVHDLDGDYLIERVTSQDVGGKLYRYAVQALSGESLGGWLNWFKKLATASRKKVIRENEVVLLLRTVEDTIVVSDALSVVSEAPETRVGYGRIGFMEIGV